MAKRKNRSLDRRLVKREAYETILIVCEREKTEKYYFDSLISHERLSSIDIHVLSGRGSDPKSVVETARDEKDKQSKYLDFDKVYCVIDRDEHKTFDDAIQLAKDNDIELIVSYPSFEYWYLCYFLYSRSPFTRSGSKSAGDNCVSLLNQKWKKKFGENYEKSIDNVYQKLFPCLDKAIENAIKALKSAEQDNEPNPSTQVHELVNKLRNLKNN